MVANVFALCTLGMASLAAAYSKAQGPNPSGNPITSPATGELVTAGKPYTIKWTPTTEGTVTLYICLGPSTNCVTQDVPFADHIPNSGSYVWTPSTDLPAGASGHGIQLVVDEGPNYGQYQYTGQFGIDNPSYQSSSTSATVYPSSSSSSSKDTYPSSTESPSGYPTGYSSATSKSASSYPTYTPPANSTVVVPTVSETSTLATVVPTGGNATFTGTLPTATGAAANVAAGGVGLGFVAAVAAFFAL